MVPSSFPPPWRVPHPPCPLTSPFATGLFHLISGTPSPTTVKRAAVRDGTGDRQPAKGEYMGARLILVPDEGDLAS